jgi:hypothetical protein
VPNNAINALPPVNERIEAGRTGPWYASGNAGVAPLALDTAAAILATPVGFVCGQAVLSARFEFRLSNGAVIADVIGVAMTVSRNDNLNLGWLNGCSRNAVP